MNKLLITGGHHSSAVPVIQELRRRYPNIDIYWVGHKHSMANDHSITLEYREITSMHIPFYDLKAGKFYRNFNPLRLLKIPQGFLRALIYLLRIKPEMVLSFGGYLSVPVVFCSWLLRIPVATHEQTAVIGYANKFVIRFADAVMYTWDSTKSYLGKRDILSKQTGLPLRNEIFVATTKEFGVNEKLPTVYITGGKTGSHKINMAVGEILPELLAKVNVIHQCGANSFYKDYDTLANISIGLNAAQGTYYLRKYIYNHQIGEVFELADLVVSRAGAHICYEMLALEKPVLFIPIPWVSHHEQEKNAGVISKLGLCEVVREDELKNPEILKDKILYMVKRLNTYRVKKKNSIKYEAQKMIVDVLDELYEKKKNKKI